MIICSVMSAFGVRSWNATDNASSVSDRYSSTSNHNTFLGKVIEGAGYPCWSCCLIIPGSFPGKFQSHFPVALGIVAPVLAHLDEQKQVHGHAHNFGDLFARIRADRLDGGAALAEDDFSLALALDE